MFTLLADPAPSEALQVKIAITQSGDFMVGALGSEFVTVSADGRGSLSVETIDDGQLEDDGAITATVVDGDGYAALIWVGRWPAAG